MGRRLFWPGQSPFSQTWLLAIPEVGGDPVLSLQTNASFAACALAGAPHDREFPALNTTKNQKIPPLDPALPGTAENRMNFSCKQIWGSDYTPSHEASDIVALQE